MNLTPRYAWSIPGFVVEKPGMGGPEAWCYTDRLSYLPGESISVHTHTTEAAYSLTLTRDGLNPEVVWTQSGLTGQAHSTPDDAYAVGCNWPQALQIDVDPTWASGFYLLTITVEVDGREHSNDHFVVVRAAEQTRAQFALVHATSTVTSYNDWGGANAYRGLGEGPGHDVPSTSLALRRPIARGMLRQPSGAPRSSNPHTPAMHELPRHPAYEWAHTHGYSRHFADAGWATYERPFTVWAEREGYQLDHLTQVDLHTDPHSLDGYAGVIFVGHDEYWTWEMRDTVDAFVDQGGHVARFGGNFLWQVRLEDDATTQVCFKNPFDDPLLSTNPTRVTTAWDAPIVERPGAATMGLTGLAGVYNRYGSAAPRSSGGFTVSRPNHWAFENTDLNYGDVFGGAPICIASFELDGVDYGVRRGMPYATGEDGAPLDLEILAMAPATAGEVDKWNGSVPIGAPLEEVHGLLGLMFGDDIPDRFTDEFYGSGMVAFFERGEGSVFNAGSTEWVNGLRLNDPFTQQVTRNVLNRIKHLESTT